MHIQCLGLNHQTASVTLREKLSFSEEQLRAALSRIGCGDGIEQLSELVILSTCNRVELYAVSDQIDATPLEFFLAETRRLAREEIQPHLYRYTDEKAVAHLLKVASGLDSLVLGEPQILGQVTRALELARGQNTTGHILSRLFQTAIHAGKRARTETHIARNPASISSLAGSVAEHMVDDIRKAQVVILGAGEMAELAVEALRKRGANRILVINRTLKRAIPLGKRWNAELSTFERLESALERADILIASTGAPHTLIHADMLRQTMASRPERALTIIDIAVPRDVDSEVGEIPNVHLHDMDSLNAELEHSLAERAAEVPHVKAILQEEADRFNRFLESLDMLPLIAHLKQRAETIRQAELQKTLRRLPNLTESEIKRIETLTQALVKKLVDAPAANLRKAASHPNALCYAQAMRVLHNIDKDANLICIREN